MRARRGVLAVCGLVGVLAAGSASAAGCHGVTYPTYPGPPLPPTTTTTTTTTTTATTTTTTATSPPGMPTNVLAVPSDACTANDPNVGLVAGSSVDVAWEAPTSGAPPTGYVVKYTVIFPNQSVPVVTTLPTFAADKTVTDPVCYPVGARFQVTVSAFNAGGSGPPVQIGPFVLPPAGLAWNSPSSITGPNTSASASSIDPCPGSVNPRVQVILTTSSGRSIMGGPSNLVFVNFSTFVWSGAGSFSSATVHDPSARISALCLDFANGVPATITASYSTHTVDVNP